MPVNLQAARCRSTSKPSKRVRLGTAEAAIRKLNRRDLTLIELAEGSRAAGAVHTESLLCRAGASMQIASVVSDVAARALVINTGIANAGTGEHGVANAPATSCRAVGESLKELGIAAEAVKAAFFYRRDSRTPCRWTNVSLPGCQQRRLHSRTMAGNRSMPRAS